MVVLDKIIDFISNPKKLIIILIGVLLFQTIGGLFYIRSLKRNQRSMSNFGQSPDEQQLLNQKFAFTPKEIAFILKGLNISPDELCQYHKSQVDSIKKRIDDRERELKDLKIKVAELKQQNPEPAGVQVLIQHIDFEQNQIKFYKEMESFFEFRSQGLRNLIKTLGLDSIMIYVNNQDSIDRNLAKSSPPKLLIPKAQKMQIVPQAQAHEERKAITNTSPLLFQTVEKEFPVMKNDETGPNSAAASMGFQNSATSLTQEEMIAMLQKYQLFDYYWNQNGRGFVNQFESGISQGIKVIIDRASRLMWQQSGSEKSVLYEEIKSWIDELNQQKFGGYSDWRLPTLREAMSLVRSEKGDLYIDTLFAKEQYCIWTSDAVTNSDWKWVVNFSLGGCCNSYSLSLSRYYIRAVRDLTTD